jgi:hypothetical protein
VSSSADARVALLGRLVDHAPLFPPASRTLDDALAEDRRAQESSYAFALGRFVCPASRVADLPHRDRALSVVLDGPFEADPSIEAVEAQPGAGLEELADLATEVYVEVALDDDLERRLDAVAAFGLRAKVRCGGSHTPSVEALARFLRACRERELAYKATAGLHHVVRSGDEHGLLNLLAAVVFDEEEALAEEEADAFRLTEKSLGWRGRRASVDEIATARRERLHSVGSCSFFEPVEELEALGFLPLAVPAR